MPSELPKVASEWNDKIFNVAPAGFEALALEVFRYQYACNAIYGDFARAVGRTPDNVHHLLHIPFLPIGFFKTHAVVDGPFEPEIVFESSGTTGAATSRHLVRQLGMYRRSFTAAFRQFYGEPGSMAVIGLLPSYLERQHSSLVLMVDELIRASGHPSSGFYLYEHGRLAATLEQLEAAGTKTLLIGVSFGLLDFAEKHRLHLKNTIVMETGGMKGRREEWTREQLHAFLMERFGVAKIHSEYGMTELLSQAYSSGNGVFQTPAWMKILLRDDDDPLTVRKFGAGVINVIDLANLHSCSFIATDDAGRASAQGFEVLGRVDGSDLRGCSLMVL